MPEFVSQISGLRNNDLAGVDSRREAREATVGEAISLGSQGNLLPVRDD